MVKSDNDIRQAQIDMQGIAARRSLNVNIFLLIFPLAGMLILVE